MFYHKLKHRKNSHATTYTLVSKHSLLLSNVIQILSYTVLFIWYVILLACLVWKNLRPDNVNCKKLHTYSGQSAILSLFQTHNAITQWTTGVLEMSNSYYVLTGIIFYECSSTGKSINGLSQKFKYKWSTFVGINSWET